MASTRRKTVELYYDVVSPYSWIAFEVLCRYRNKWEMDLVFKPFLLGGVMQESGNQPPATVANKGRYMLKDLNRLAKHFQIPIRQPANFVEMAMVKGTVNPQRFLTAVNTIAPEYTENLSRELWMRTWSQDVDATEPESLRQAARKAGLNEELIKKAMEKMNSPENKGKLKAITKEALSYKAFGAPTIIVTTESGKKELVFGSDRFHILADLLGETYAGPLTEYAKSKL